MKNTILAIFTSIALGSSASATTILADGGTLGAQFYTSGGTILTATNSSFSVGLWDGTTFTEFAPANNTIGISTIPVATFAGRWSGSAGDTSATANAFNGQQIWFRVETTADGGGTAYLAGSALFPTNGGGVGDDRPVDSRTLLQLGAGSDAGSRAYDAGDGRIIVGVVPEPSIALLGALGVLGLLRRRR